MDPAKRKTQKEQLLHDIQAWDRDDPRRFKDIVRNAVDVDIRYLAGLMKAFNVSRDQVKAWGSGKDVPNDFERIVIVDRLQELIEEDLNA